MLTRTYTELIRLPTFEERFEYLKLGGGVGRATFGFDRYVNQRFYASREWQDVRSFVVVRDEGCDLAVPGYEVSVNPLIHHMNPISVDDIHHQADWVLNPEFLITTRLSTHNAIHYGGESRQPRVVTQRSAGDTKLW